MRAFLKVQVFCRNRHRRFNYSCLDCLTLKLKSFRSFETSVTVRQLARRKVPEDFTEYRAWRTAFRPIFDEFDVSVVLLRIKIAIKMSHSLSY